MLDITSIVLFQIDKTSKLAKQFSQKEFDEIDLGITVDQWVLLKILDEKKSMSQKEMADMSSRDRASITRSLDLLESKKFITRKIVPNNRRQHDIRLSPSGKEFIESNMSMIQSHRQKSIAGFSNEEIQTFMSMLYRIQNNLK